MKREIKFRAWVPNENCMIGHREVIERAHLQFDDSLNRSDIVMQFTGLHDKNGKEIYEGDIVSDRVSNRIVVYQAPEFIMKRQVKANTWKRFIRHPEDNQYQEVIGNIS